MGSKPSHRSSTELVHSQTPPMPDCPERVLPFDVTGTGWNA